MCKKDVRIAIIGAGIAGTSAAVALNRRGFRVDVYEQSPVLKEVGAGIGMRPPSVKCFEKWGIVEDLYNVTVRSDYMEIIAGDDNVFIKEQWPVLTEDRTEAYARLIHRADLLDTLVAHIPQDQIHLNYRFTEIVDHGNYAEVRFENGEVIEADIVIAADGIRSPIRGQIFGQHDPIYSGYLAHRALIHKDEALGMASDENIVRIYVDGKNSIYLLPLQGRNQVSVDVTIPGEFAWRPELTKEQIMEGIKGFGPKVQQVIANIPIEDIVSRPLCDLEPFTKWSTNTIALIGDAAHAMLHNQGQGANMAIQDAEVLTEAIEEAATPAEALFNYQERRKPITKLYQDLSRLFPTDEAETAFPEKAHI